MIPHDNTFAHGTVVSCKHDAEGNIIGFAHDNPILDSCLYAIEFADGIVMALTAMPSPKPCTPSVTLMETSISSWMNSVMSIALTMPSC